MNIWKDRNWSPMLLNEIKEPFDSEDYIFEVKFDGIRAVCFVNNNEVKIMSRNKKDISYLFPELENIKKLCNNNVIFDGEIIIIEDGKPSFTKLQERLNLKNKTKIDCFSRSNPVIFIVFDILYENKDLTNLDLIKRKEILNKYIDNDYFVKSEVFPTYGIKLFQSIKEMNLEGIVAKYKYGKYHVNERTSDFIKIKNTYVEEFYIGGFEENNISGVFVIGELINNSFIYVGKVLISKNEPLFKKIKLCRKSKNYFSNFNENINYVKPEIKICVEYLEKTKNGTLRHPRIYK